MSQHRVYIERQDGTVVSSFHDIPLFADQDNGILNIVVEIPRWTNAKMEISIGETLNPIKQNTKRGRLRYTWEDPSYIYPDTKTKGLGNCDPLHVCEIGEQIGYVRQIKQVKVLGIMALLDEGKTDWNVIVVYVDDPLAGRLKTSRMSRDIFQG
ncbi:hypothetical protein Clacol_008052 [Clathrus columnatus]|uniref:inorganic diphosphatase n=1 Tax=Clathrus columnatus TaxID=1419009 RepID=A0AAV5APG2_9AGAM|nr:hypothetical protein Clacol_008052 [Clathrus columnatus]